MKQVFKVRLERASIHRVEVEIDPDSPETVERQVERRCSYLSAEDVAACLTEDLKWEVEVLGKETRP
jgi:hypothetical protein